MDELTQEQKNLLEEAVEWLVPQVEEAMAGGDFEDVSDYLLQGSLERLLKIKGRRDPVSDLRYSEIPERAANMLLAMSQKSSVAFALASELAATNILANKPLPEALRVFAAEVLVGEAKRPATPKGRRKKWHKNLMIYTLAKEVEAEFGLPLTRNEASPPHSACDALAEALSRVGYEMDANAIKARCVSKQFVGVRAQFKLMLTQAAKHKTLQTPAG